MGAFTGKESFRQTGVTLARFLNTQGGNTMKLKMLASLFILSSLAWGQRQHQTQQQQQNVNNTTTNSHNNTSDSTATGGDSSGQSTSFNSQEIRQTPPAFAPDAYPTAPCRVAGSAGGSSPYFGLSIGGSKLDKDCA